MVKFVGENANRGTDNLYFWMKLRTAGSVVTESRFQKGVTVSALDLFGSRSTSKFFARSRLSPALRDHPELPWYACCKARARKLTPSGLAVKEAGDCTKLSCNTEQAALYCSRGEGPGIGGRAYFFDFVQFLPQGMKRWISPETDVIQLEFLR